MYSEHEILDRNEQDNRRAAHFHQRREALYTLFARCFGLEIDPEAWEALGTLPGLAGDYLVFLGGPDRELAEGLESLARVREELASQGDASLLVQLAREYASNFLGVGPDTASLCESHYRHDDRSKADSIHFRVKNHYQMAELAKSGTFSEPEDHLAVEFSFMAHLCARGCANAAAKPRELRALLEWQRDFLQGHLLIWVPAFNHNVAGMAQGRFYTSIAALATRFLELENGWLTQKLQDWNCITQTDEFVRTTSETSESEI